jgi:hypothetical protein
MRQLLALALLLAIAAWGGCARGGKAKVGSAGQNLIVKPETMLVGRVVRVNPMLRIAVLNFPIGRLPALDQRLGVYRQGLKVAEIRVTGPQRDDNIVGDLVAGEAQAGDEVRDR